MKKFSKNLQEHKNLIFLSIQDVLAIHEELVKNFGGLQGIRDIKLLESALAQPEIKIFGESACKDIYEMAATYAYHIIKNHPFVDGNKRTGIVTALTFLDINDVFIHETPELYGLALGIAASQISKPEIAQFFKKYRAKE